MWHGSNAQRELDGAHIKHLELKINISFLTPRMYYYPLCTVYDYV